MGRTKYRTRNSFIGGKRKASKRRGNRDVPIRREDYYIKPAARADLQISLGKTRHVHPNCVFTLENRTFMTSHVTAKEHVTP